MTRTNLIAWCSLWVIFPAGSVAAEPKMASHPPMRSLPQPSSRPIIEGPAYHIDPKSGNDAHDGSAGREWKTIGHALTKMQPGDTLYLHGGVYYEHVSIALAGTKEKPITIRSSPGDLAIIDGGLREFAESPATAWEPVPGSTVGEYRSAKAYPKLGTIVLGHFADSMIPLHGYRYAHDLRSVNLFWNLTGKIEDDPKGLYCGPGVWYDAGSGRIHCRLGHTEFMNLRDEDQYRGETDPRKIPLCIAGGGGPLSLSGAKWVKLQDVAVRGGSRATVNIENCETVELDGVSIFGGSPALQLWTTDGLHITNSVIRGISAPWSWRGGQKYRGNAAYLVVARPERGGSKNVEIDHSELTDCHDGPYIGTIHGLRFHHNLVDNFNDDGIYLTGAGVGGDLQIYQNRITRCLHCFSFAGKYPLGAGVYIFRNLIDQRGEVRYQWPQSAADSRFLPSKPGGPPQVPHTGFLCGDHGSPTWEPIYFYHNTVIHRDKAFRSQYGFGMARATAGTKRRVLNNIFVQLDGLPGQAFPPVADDFEADHNLFWNPTEGPNVRGDFFATARAGKLFADSKRRGWGASDRFADPQFAKFADWGDPSGDYRLTPKSRAIDAGQELPAAWPDPLRNTDRGPPDLGALPLGSEPFQIGAGKK